MVQSVNWGADVPVSLPSALSEDNPGIVPMDGFCFTATGLAFDLSQEDRDRISIPTFAPDDLSSPVIRYDEGL